MHGNFSLSIGTFLSELHRVSLAVEFLDIVTLLNEAYLLLFFIFYLLSQSHMKLYLG